MQSMVDICVKFTRGKNLKFGTNVNPEKSKTKCIALSKKSRDRQNLLSIKLDGLPLPWVQKVSHLGCTLESDNSMKQDIALKRGKFIGKINSLTQEFYYASTEVQLKLLTTYATSFYGSPLWDPFSKECDRIYRSWNVTIRNLLNLDRRTHRYLIEPLTECLHPKVMLISRMVGFYRKQLNSPKLSIRFLMKLAENDQRSAIGKTLEYVMRECNIEKSGLDCLTPSMIKKKISYMPVPPSEKWRIAFLKELLSARKDASVGVDICGFTSSELDDIIKWLATS